MTESKNNNYPTQKIKVGILGCTGIVGQRFIELLYNHPLFIITKLGASPLSAGKSYRNVVHWKLIQACPESIMDILVEECLPRNFDGCTLVFSALDSSVAEGLEETFAAAGFPVFSNAASHRCDIDVPIIVPYVNAFHMSIIDHQRKQRGYGKGFIVTNANCSTVGLAVALKPLMDHFGVDGVFVTTMQAVSGAGYPGVPSLDITDNIIPFVSGEEPKLESEANKILGGCTGTRFNAAEFSISAHCNRVNVTDGHTLCVSVKLKNHATVCDIKKVLKGYKSVTGVLPSTPTACIYIAEETDRPQPRLDRIRGGGYTITVGRIRPCPILDIKFVVCSHNTILGAAGGSILNAELAYGKGYLD
jgi:aspartate-semialdehyde dehydrogenase